MNASKWFFLVMLHFGLNDSGFAQARSFRDFIIAASSKTNPTILTENFKEVGGASRFVSDVWSVGYALPKNGELISDNYQFNYDYLDKTLYLRSIETKDIIAVSMNSVKKFGIVNDFGVTLHFTKVIGIDPTYPLFFEIIGGSDTSDIAIFKSKEVEYRKPNNNDYLRNFNGDYKGTYKPNEQYYLYNKSKGYRKVSSISRKDLLIYFGDSKDKVLAAFKKKKSLTDIEAKALVTHILNHPINL